MVILSHPNVKLYNHLDQVYNSGISIFSNNRRYLDSMQIMRYILLFHDFGKCSEYFQEYIRGNTVNQQLKRHGQVGALFAYYYVNKVVGLSQEDSQLIFWCIKQHHGNLKNYKDVFTRSLSDDKLIAILQSISNNIKQVSQLYSKFNIIIDNNTINGCIDILKNNQYPYYRTVLRTINKDTQSYFKFKYIYSILVFSDVFNAITKKKYILRKNKCWKKKHILFYKDITFNNCLKINDLRNKCNKNIQYRLKKYYNCSNIFSINVPTGLGKTLSGIEAAIFLKTRCKLDRIIYCLPFTSIIDQLSNILDNILQTNNINNNSSNKLLHHHLSELTYVNKSQLQLEDQISKHLIQSWNSQFIVTTFYQLFYSIFSNYKPNQYKYHNISNSVIVLDQIQTIPHKYWNLIRRVLLDISNNLNCKIIIMSATLPMIFSVQNKEVVQLIDNSEQVYNQVNRTLINLQLLQQNNTIDSISNHIVNTSTKYPEKDIMIIVNTIRSSIQMYNALKLKLSKEKRVIYLSKNIIPKHRLQRIEEIKSCHDCSGRIIVTTQLIEAGVDIDVDIIYRDYAPLDSIFQSSGRCNRNAKYSQLSQVYIVKLVDKIDDNGNIKYHCNYIYESFLLNCMQITLNNYYHSSNIIPEKQFYSLAKQYYTNIKQKQSNETSDVLIQKIHNLSMESLCYKQDDNKYDKIFQLIENDCVDKKNVFIVFPKEQHIPDSKQLTSIQLRNLYYKYIKQNDITKLKNIFRKMSKYIIQVKSKDLKDILKDKYDENKFLYIMQCNIYYNNEIGFNIPQNVML